jgi:hypothetical protein
MDTIKTIGVAAVVALIVAGGVILFSGDGDSLGSAPGVALWPTSVTTFTQGGGIYATSSSAAASTLLASSIAEANIVDMTWNYAAGTLTLPATSTMTNIAPNAGDMRTIWIRNASPTAATSTTIAAGTGMTFKSAATSSLATILVGDTDADNTVRLDFVRKADSDFNVYLTKYQDN